MSGRKTMNRASNSGANNSNVHTEVDQIAQRLQEVQFPVANVMKLMRGILPIRAKVDDDSTESVLELLKHFIFLITKKANERFKREKRKTVIVEDLLWAMNEFGLTNYAEVLTQYIHRFRDFNTRMSNIEMPNVVLALPSPNAPLSVLPINSAPMPAYECPHFPPNVLFYDPATATLVHSRDLEMAKKGYGTAVSSSTADPYGQFKQ